MTDNQPTPAPGRDPEADTASSWSVEHYGFAAEATMPASTRTTHTPQRPASPAPARRPRSLARLLLAAGALALGIGAGAGATGFAVAQASTGGNAGRTAAMHPSDAREGHGGAHDGRR